MTIASDHYNIERQSRYEFITQNIGVGNVVDSFIVDRGHPGGAEIHSVTDTAIIIIHNQKTNKLITELIARPEQIRRLYRLYGRTPPRKIIELAYDHNKYRYNEK